MVNTNKTFSSEDLSFIVSYDNGEEVKAQVTFYSDGSVLTLDLDKESLTALGDALGEARYSTPTPF